MKADSWGFCGSETAWIDGEQICKLMVFQGRWWQKVTESHRKSHWTPSASVKYDRWTGTFQTLKLSQLRSQKLQNWTIWPIFRCQNCKFWKLEAKNLKKMELPSLAQVLVLSPDQNRTVPPSADVQSICQDLGYEHRVAPSSWSCFWEVVSLKNHGGTQTHPKNQLVEMK